MPPIIIKSMLIDMFRLTITMKVTITLKWICNGLDSGTETSKDAFKGN